MERWRREGGENDTKRGMRTRREDEEKIKTEMEEGERMKERECVGGGGRHSDLSTPHSPGV